jgi:hypothetical protein
VWLGVSVLVCAWGVGTMDVLAVALWVVSFGVGGCVGPLHVTWNVFGLVHCCLLGAGGGVCIAACLVWLLVELGVLGLVCAPLCHIGVLAGAMVVVCQCTGLWWCVLEGWACTWCWLLCAWGVCTMDVPPCASIVCLLVQ